MISEGNYLLLGDGHWAELAPLLDDLWCVDVDDALRTGRLTRRYEQFGRTRAEATEWVAATDEPNARLIPTSKARGAHSLGDQGGASLTTAFVTVAAGVVASAVISLAGPWRVRWDERHP